MHLHVNALVVTEDRDVATVSCAINIALVEIGNRYLAAGIPLSGLSNTAVTENIAMLETQVGQYERLDVSDELLSLFRDSCARFVANSNREIPRCFQLPVQHGAALYLAPLNGLPAEMSNTLRIPQLLRDAQYIRSAAQLSSDLFEGVPRKWGPNETLPLFAHEYEVGMLLALAGESRDLVIAGLLHDVLENYVEVDAALLRRQISDQFGGHVLQLIEGVTEPPKSVTPGNWWDRKLAVLYQIKDGDKDTASLACAAKISTLAAGNKMLYMGHPVSDWSSGNLEDNVRVFNSYAAEFRRKGVSPLLLNQFEAELTLFKRGTILQRESAEISA